MASRGESKFRPYSLRRMLGLRAKLRGSESKKCTAAEKGNGHVTCLLDIYICSRYTNRANLGGTRYTDRVRMHAGMRGCSVRLLLQVS